MTAMEMPQFIDEFETPKRRWFLSGNKLFDEENNIIGTRSKEVAQKLGLAAVYDIDLITTVGKDHLKEYRQPLRQWLMHEKTDPTKSLPAELQSSIEALYGQSVDLLEALAYQQKIDMAGGSRHDAEIHYGISTELAIFSLAARDMQGNPDDPFIVIPASPAEDSQPRNRLGEFQGYDFRVLERQSGDNLKLQVKTTESTAAKKVYEPSILVVSLEHIADGTDNITALTHAMIDEIQGNDFDESIIEAATRRLHQSIERHLDKMRTAYAYPDTEQVS